MGNKNLRTDFLGILMGLLVLVSALNYFMLPVNANDEEEEGVNFIVEYSKKIYDGDSDVWNFSVHNVNLTEDDTGKAFFFFKIYLNDSLLWNEYNDTDYHIWQCDKGAWVTRNYTFPGRSGPAEYKVRIELYWFKNETPYLMVEHTKVIKIAKVFIANWAPSPRSVPWRGSATPSSLFISFANGGNDDMHNASIVVIDTNELKISPLSQDLGNIYAGENKTISFSIMASATKERTRTYNPKFQVIYNDFRGITYTEEYTASVDAIVDPTIQSLLNIISGVAIALAAGGVVAFAALIKKAKKRGANTRKT